MKTTLARISPQRTNSNDQYIIPRHSRQSMSAESQASKRTLVQRSKAFTYEFKQKQAKNHFLAMVSEYVGTTLFLLLAFGGTTIANSPDFALRPGRLDTSSLLYIACSFGLSLMVNAWVFFRVSGGLFNPAVSLGLALVKAISPLRAILLSVAQILGGMTAAALVKSILPGPLAVRTILANDINLAQGFFLEMFLTSILTMCILLLAVEKHKATFMAPIGIGAALLVCELVGVPYTGGSLNPARSFGPEVANKAFSPEHWIYWVAPCLGSAIASGFYHFLKFMEFESCNPNQDADQTSTNDKEGTNYFPNNNPTNDGFSNSSWTERAMITSPQSTRPSVAKGFSVQHNEVEPMDQPTPVGHMDQPATGPLEPTTSDGSAHNPLGRKVSMAGF